MLLGLFLPLLVGTSLGLFGGGGSMLSVVIFSFAFGMSPKTAIAASLFVTGVSSSAALLARQKRLLGSARTGVAFGGAGMVGAFAGGRLAALIPESVLRTAFGAVMLLTSVAMLRHTPRAHGPGEQRANEKTSAHTPRLVPLALGIGIVTGMLGAGGGLLIVPALVLRGRMPMKRAVDTSLFVIALQSLAGFLGHLAESSLDWAVVVPFTLTAMLGSVVGAVVARRAPPVALRRGFAALVLLVAIVVVVRELPQAVELSLTCRRLFESPS